MTGWQIIDEKWYYFYDDGSLAVSTVADGCEVDDKGVRKNLMTFANFTVKIAE